MLMFKYNHTNKDNTADKSNSEDKSNNQDTKKNGFSLKPEEAEKIKRRKNEEQA